MYCVEASRLYVSDYRAWERLVTLYEALRRSRDSREPKGWEPAMTCFRHRESHLYSRNHPAWKRLTRYVGAKFFRSLLLYNNAQHMYLFINKVLLFNFSNKIVSNC